MPKSPPKPTLFGLATKADLKAMEKRLTVLIVLTDSHGSESSREIRKDLKHVERLIRMTQQELAAGLVQIQTQATKIGNEQAARSDAALARIAELEALISEGGEITPEVVDAFNGVKTAMQALDDTIPDPVSVKK